MPRVILLLYLFSLSLSQQVSFPVSVPRTHIGNDAVACNPDSFPDITGGFATNFFANTYACTKWNDVAKDLPDCFVALNGVCGIDRTFCDHFILMKNSRGETQKCRVIDFCDPKDCDFLDSGHLRILNNERNSHYKFVNLGKTVVPYAGAGEQPIISWAWSH